MFTFPGEWQRTGETSILREEADTLSSLSAQMMTWGREPPGHLQKTVLVGVITIQTRATCALEKKMATHPSILAWKIPWTEEPGGLQSTRWQREGHDWVTNTFTFNGLQFQSETSNVYFNVYSSKFRHWQGSLEIVYQKEIQNGWWRASQKGKHSKRI